MELEKYLLPVLTPDEMRETERHAFSLGVSSLLLMEQAAYTVTDELEKMLGGCRGKRVLFLCGTGNNGGDGLAAARLFWLRGGLPFIAVTGMPKTPDAHTNFCYAQALGLPFVTPERARETRFDATVDALFGIGLRGSPDAESAKWIALAVPPVLAVDIPSGMDGRTGAAAGACVRAARTVTFHSAKTGLFLSDCRENAGQITVRDIGLRSTAAHMCEMLSEAALHELDTRPLQAHKGNMGRVLCYCGKMGMAGAAAMAADAAVHAGAGLTTVLCPEEIMPVLQTLVPGAMAVAADAGALPAYDVLALGCGLGQDESVWRNILRIYDPDKGSVWDADALNLLAKHKMRLGENAVITPHPGEAARLLSRPVVEIMEDRLGTVRALAREYGCTAVFKSDVTLIASPEGPVYLNASGSPALAKGGSGDVLCGMTAALMAQEPENDPALTAALACLWHGCAGRLAGDRAGIRECTAKDVIACLHEARVTAGGKESGLL